MATSEEPMLSGWAVFAGSVMLLAGSFQIITGLVALLRQNFYVVTSTTLVVFNLRTWGWIELLMGILLVAAAFSLFAGGMFGRIVAIVLAVISAIANLLFLPAYPLWSILVIALDVMIIYGVSRPMERVTA